MKATRTFKDMTPEEKRKSLELWHKFYDSQLSNDFMESWRYWTQRMEYLETIGIDVSKDAGRKMWMNKVTAEV
ncbi:MAG: hypothetical protein ACOCXH_03665 [Cyclobacteriaceae bacterium]